jgi:hypothetical protein
VSCASHAGLDLVGDEEDVVLVADLPEAVQEGWRCGNITSFTQNRL